MRLGAWQEDAGPLVGADTRGWAWYVPLGSSPGGGPSCAPVSPDTVPMWALNSISASMW